MAGKSEGEENVPTDRRVARTRDLLHHALMSLIQTKGYEAITVQDICDKANVGKSTFYAHYTSKDDLKRSGIEHMRMALSKELAAVLRSMGLLRHPGCGSRSPSSSMPEPMPAFIIHG